MKVSVVIPVYNEENRIAKTAEELCGYLGSSFDESEVVFSNDGSTDSTLEIARGLEEKYANVKVVSYEKNRGKGSAVRNGMLHADGDLIFFTDCDLAYGTEVIGRAVKLFEESGADVVIGSRNLQNESYGGYSFIRRCMSKVYFKLISLMSGFKLSDSQCGFKGFTKECAHSTFSECKIDSFAFDLEALLLAQEKGCKIAEMPVKIINHDNGQTKVKIFSDSVRMLKDIRKIKRSK